VFRINKKRGERRVFMGRVVGRVAGVGGVVVVAVVFW
jgi:hypothetical protein